MLALLPLAVLTCLYANTDGTDWRVDPGAIHGIVALAIVGLSPWKSVIVRRGLRRPTRSTWTSIVLLALVVATLGTGLLHAAGFQGMLGFVTVMQVHIGGALVALVLVVAHFRAHPVRVRRHDVDRRAFLRAAITATASVVAWLGIQGTMKAVGLPGGDRRFTGSHERGSFDPSRMPVTSWLDDRVQRVSGPDWRVRVPGRRLSLADLVSYSSDDVTATLDCTSAWYSRQVWRGVRLDHLIDAGEHRSIVVRSATGYGRRFPVRDLEHLWLATHVGGAPLSAGHGYPARLVAPGRRGFWWVKWVTDIETSDVAWWIQLPFPAT
jgi:DMSO/TMAO reductase YedYZ molybdopterin-dependent catalytic subunit